jgi:leucyl-tRNA synthetase
MTFQGLSPERSKIEQLMEMDGAAMVGTKIKTPFGLVPEVYVLPMDNVLARGRSCFDSFHSRLF